jgi:hypothetical protein
MKVNDNRKALRNQTRDMKQKLNQITNGAKIDEQVLLPKPTSINPSRSCRWDKQGVIA